MANLNTGVLNAAKEIIRIANTAGLSKDIIDLLEKKVAILTDELTSAQQKITRLEIENGQLRAQLQNNQPVGFQENMGVLWKPTPTGFEPIPYCKECKSHPIMSPLHRAGKWVCANGDHVAPISVQPPS